MKKLVELEAILLLTETWYSSSPTTPGYNMRERGTSLSADKNKQLIDEQTNKWNNLDTDCNQITPI